MVFSALLLFTALYRYFGGADAQVKKGTPFIIISKKKQKKNIGMKIF